MGGVMTCSSLAVQEPLQGQGVRGSCFRAGGVVVFLVHTLTPRVRSVCGCARTAHGAHLCRAQGGRSAPEGWGVRLGQDVGAGVWVWGDGPAWRSLENTLPLLPHQAPPLL